MTSGHAIVKLKTTYLADDFTLIFSASTALNSSDVPSPRCRLPIFLWRVFVLFGQRGFEHIDLVETVHPDIASLGTYAYWGRRGGEEFEISVSIDVADFHLMDIGIHSDRVLWPRWDHLERGHPVQRDPDVGA